MLRFGRNRWLYTRQLSLLLTVLLLVLGSRASLAYGAADISMSSILTAITSFDNETEHLIIRMMRLPRALLAMMVSASLAVAGIIAVYFLSSLEPRGATPLNLTVTGAALTALLSSITIGVLSLGIVSVSRFRVILMQFHICLCYS